METLPATALPRSSDAILAQLRKLLAAPPDPHNVEASRCLDALPFDMAKEFLDAGITAEQWEPRRVATVEKVTQSGVGYYEFAWSKANQRETANSALRTTAHYRGIAWLLGDDDLYAKLQGPPQFLGKAALVLVAPLLGVDWKLFDDGYWRKAFDDSPPVTANEALAELTSEGADS